MTIFNKSIFIPSPQDFQSMTISASYNKSFSHMESSIFIRVNDRHQCVACCIHTYIQYLFRVNFWHDFILNSVSCASDGMKRFSLILLEVQWVQDSLLLSRFVSLKPQIMHHLVHCAVELLGTWLLQSSLKLFWSTLLLIYVSFRIWISCQLDPSLGVVLNVIGTSGT